MGAGDCYKRFLQIVSVAYLFFGFGSLGYAAYLFTQTSEPVEKIDWVGFASTNVLYLVFGLLMITVGIMGCCGAGQARENNQDNSKCHCCLYGYFVIQAITFCMFAGLAAYIAVMVGLVNEAQVGLDASVTEQTGNTANEHITKAISLNEATKNSWITVEDKFDCCGYYTFNDEYGYGAKFCNTTLYSNETTSGCQEQVLEFVKSNGTLSLGLSAGIAGVMFLALTATCCLCCCNPRFEKDERENEARRRNSLPMNG